jgi:hypothetical protein
MAVVCALLRDHAQRQSTCAGVCRWSSYIPNGKRNNVIATVAYCGIIAALFNLSADHEVCGELV